MATRTLSRRRTRWAVLATAAAVVAAVVLLVFEPQTLFIDTRVDDDFPSPAAVDGDVSVGSSALPDAGEEVADQPGTSPDPISLAAGDFISRDHATSGRATAYELADDQRVLRLEGLVTDNGPDLKVYLSAAPADAPAGDFDETFIDLGALAGNLGNQNYEIPAQVDLDAYASVVIWCDRFDVAFGSAPLQ